MQRKNNIKYCLDNNYTLIEKHMIIRDNLLEEIVKRLPAKEAYIVRHIILSNVTQCCVARKLKVSQPRVSQLLKQAIKHMQVICKDIPDIF